MRYNSGKVCVGGEILRTNDEKRKAFYRGMGNGILEHLNRDSNCSTYKDRIMLKDVPVHTVTKSQTRRTMKGPFSDDQFNVPTWSAKEATGVGEEAEVLTSAIDLRAAARVQASRLNLLGYSLLNAFEYEVMFYPEEKEAQKKAAKAPIRFARSRDIADTSFHWRALLRALNQFQS
eukprot:GHVS01108351.1.p1 GENE.GHVS01108351.1~~GHVS01108351.1.p1  ORF type:complete len:176 (+),score=26.90 GHVS01108351.1:770-1297(+)